MIEGGPTDDPPLGPGGEMTPLANPTATAQAVARLLADHEYWQHENASGWLPVFVQVVYLPDLGVLKSILPTNRG